jgi:hypothetical protein
MHKLPDLTLPNPIMEINKEFWQCYKSFGNNIGQTI